MFLLIIMIIHGHLLVVGSVIGPAKVLSIYNFKISTLDYFEIERLIEDLAKLYSCSCAASWFKVNNQRKPTRDEFRSKVVDFMSQFEHTLSAFPDTPESDKFKAYARKLLQKETKSVLDGANKDVEKRYNYFVNSR
jgi:hypothetical protein